MRVIPRTVVLNREGVVAAVTKPEKVSAPFLRVVAATGAAPKELVDGLRGPDGAHGDGQRPGAPFAGTVYAPGEIRFELRPAEADGETSGAGRIAGDRSVYTARSAPLRLVVDYLSSFPSARIEWRTERREEKWDFDVVLPHMYPFDRWDATRPAFELATGRRAGPSGGSPDCRCRSRI